MGKRIRVSAALQKRQHAKAGKTFPEFIVVSHLVTTCYKPKVHPHLLGLRFFASFPKGLKTEHR